MGLALLAGRSQAQAGGAGAAPGRYWVRFQDKRGVPFNAARYFSPAAQARRQRQGLPPADATDYPVRADYVAAVQARVDTLTLVSRWFNAVACRATPTQAAAQNGEASPAPGVCGSSSIACHSAATSSARCRATSGTSGVRTSRVCRAKKPVGTVTAPILPAVASRRVSTPELSGRTLVMSGGSRGIGLAIAVAAARRGVNSVLLAKTGTWSLDLVGVGPQIMATCLMCGAIGGVLSVMIRVTRGQRLSIDCEQGPVVTTLAGAFRPLIGAVFGIALYVFVITGLVPFAVPADDLKQQLFFAGLAFLAGFSERWAQDTIVQSAPTRSMPPGRGNAPATTAASPEAGPVEAGAGERVDDGPGEWLDPGHGAAPTS
jgi:hypothetical protein